MKLLAPEVVAPLSECSTSVQIRGNISGATLVIKVNDIESSHISNGVNNVYHIGTSLHANDVVTAWQEFADAKSPESQAVIVQDIPQQLSALTIVNPLYKCGRGVFLSGGVPGATVEANIDTQSAGTGKVVSGTAGCRLNPVLDNDTEVLTLIQSTCNNLSSSQSSPPALPQPSPLLPPVISKPITECDESITISEVVPGAFVEIYRNGVLAKSYLSYGSGGPIPVKPLEKGDHIEVLQGFKCKIESPDLETFSEKASATVEPFDALNAPNIVGTLCPGSTWVTLSNLKLNARVILLLDDQELGQTDIWNITQTFYNLPPLPSGGKLKAYMVWCDKEGPANTVAISEGEQPLTKLEVSDLYACAAFVFVKIPDPKNLLLYLTNKNNQQISPYYNLIGDRGLIPVSPSLVVNDQITVNVTTCGGDKVTFGPFPVISGAAPPPVFAKPITSGKNYVTIWYEPGYAGAVIHVYVNDQLRGYAISLGNLSGIKIYLTTVLEIGDEVFGTQTLCGRVSRPSEKIIVVKPYPEKPARLQPPDGAENVSVQPMFQWSDPGAGAVNQAEAFKLKVSDSLSSSSEPVIDSGWIPSSQLHYQSSSFLQHNTTYKWWVLAKNSTGETDPITPFTFKTGAAPPPQEGHLEFVSEIYSNHPLGLFPRDELFTISIDLANTGGVASAEYTVNFALWYGQSNLDSVSGDFGPLAAGDTTTILSAPVIVVGVPDNQLTVVVTLYQDGEEPIEADRPFV
jgi:hypothetical protein